MLSKDEINKIYEKVAKLVDINEELFDQAEEHYKDLGKWIDEKTPEYKISIYPQGSFALGTVVKPITDSDEYDLDLVCKFDQSQSFDAKELKVDIIKPLLKEYDDIEYIQEKKRCWQVKYEKSSNFHMDIIPAIDKLSYINITDKNEETINYNYIGSNPQGYIDWFTERKREAYQLTREEYINKREVKFQAEIAEIKEYKLKTPLQKAIQILKRHRDIMFQDDTDNIAPISIIITTVAAQLYNSEDNIYDTLREFAMHAKKYVIENKKNDEYYIENPSFTGSERENFADKWNEYPERAEAFFDWIDEVQVGLIDNPSTNKSAIVANLLGLSLGENLIRNAYRSLDDYVSLESLTNSIHDKDIMIMPEVKALFSVPHREKPPWKLPKKSRVFLKAIVTDSDGNTYTYKNNGQPIKKNSKIEFTAFSSIGAPYYMKWQVVNTGEEARQKNSLRGGFEDSNNGKNTRTENTEYTGSHYVQCFVIKKGKCAGKSERVIVNIQ